MNAKVAIMERRSCPRCSDLDRLFDRVRRIELILAIMAGALLGDLGLKIVLRML